MAQDLVPVTLVVAFYSRCGSSEARALAAAVGAVNARALIRMRRMSDLDSAQALADASPACAVELARMRKEYVPPTEADLRGTDALILAVPDGFDAASPVWAPLVSMLATLDADGAVRGKVAAVVGGGVGGGSASATASFVSLLHDRGWVVVPSGAAAPRAGESSSPGHPRAHGRLVAEISRALKSAAR